MVIRQWSTATFFLISCIALSPELLGSEESIGGPPSSVLSYDGRIRLQFIGRYESGISMQSAAEIVAFEPAGKQVFVVNAFSGQVDCLDLRNPASPVYLRSIDVSDIGAVANSVAVHGDIVAIAVQATKKTDPGYVAFYSTDGDRRSVVQVGALPDALTISPNGRYLLVANEGEPDDDYLVDPEGSVSIIDLSGGIDSIEQSDVRTADFRIFNGREEELKKAGVRIFGPGASAAQDLEPEWIDITSDSKTAFVCLQENNAIAVVDIAESRVTQILPLGFKDWSAAGQWSGKGFDASDRDGAIRIQHWPVYGIYQPDTIKVMEVNGETFLLGANEGDTRIWGDWSEVATVGELKLDSRVFPDAESLQKDNHLGRLQVTKMLGIAEDCELSGDPAAAGASYSYSALYAFGGRSMSIWKVNGDALELVYDSGSQMEETIALMTPDYFNADHQARPKQFDRRSPARGPEPEGMALGTIGRRTYAFVGLERIGGIMVYDVTIPAETRLVQYINTRDYSIGEDPSKDQSRSDLGPEGLCFISADQSPDPKGRPLLLVGNEVSGTTAVFAVELDSEGNLP